ncbi:MAG: ribosome biogenesis GTPase Der, partial [Armatimonadetes bacterium]|nr:ribosome biogenesis GTPase Der [Armatimonadota bacterium]
EFQISEAVRNADLVLFCIDTQAGITPQDDEIATMLREQRLGKDRADKDHRRVPVRVLATKCDGPKWETHAYEFSSLGFDVPLMCSAKSNFFRRDMLDTLWELMPEPDDDKGPKVDLRLAVIGKRNSGKSTLVNTLAGQPRMIVSEIAGTTRDAVDVYLEYDGKSLLVIDTAGLRRKKSMKEAVEWYALDRAKRAIDRSDAVLLLIDATEKISQVDEQLTTLVKETMKPVVIVVNKWDLAQGRANPQGRPVTPGDYEKYVRKELKGLAFAPIVLVSAKENLNVKAAINLAHEMFAQSCERVTTGKLNRLVRNMLDRRGPSNKLGSFVKVFYVAQIRVLPPTVLLVVNKPELFTANYERYMMNRFREELPFPEVPIKLVVRARRRDERDLQEGELPRAVAEIEATLAAGGDVDSLFEDEE